MPLSGGEQIGAVFGGAAVVIVAAGGIVKAAQMRGETHNRWQRRVQFADSALEQREIDELEQLRDALEAVLPTGDDAPGLSTFDPTPLAERTGQVAKLHTSRTRMHNAFKTLRWLGTVFTVLLAIFIVAVGLATLYYAELTRADWVQVVGLACGAVSVIGLALAGGVFAWKHKRLADAVILSGYGDPGGDGE